MTVPINVVKNNFFYYYLLGVELNMLPNFQRTRKKALCKFKKYGFKYECIINYYVF